METVKGMGSCSKNCWRAGSKVEVRSSCFLLPADRACETEGGPLCEEQRTEKETLKEIIELNLLEEKQLNRMQTEKQQN